LPVDANQAITKQLNEIEKLKQAQVKLSYDAQDLEDGLRGELDKIVQRIEDIHAKTEELYKIQKDKTTILNIPTGGFGEGDGKKRMDEEFVIESLEKIRDFINQENKRMKDELLKHHLEMEGKLKEKIDRKEMQDIESKP